MNPCTRCGEQHTGCAGHRKNGNPCRLPPLTGLDKCRMHCGEKLEVAKAKGAIRAATMQAHERAQRMASRAGVDVDPIEHLLDTLHVAAAMVHVWGGMVADLDNAGEINLQVSPGVLRGQSWIVPHEYTANDGSVKVRYETRTDPLMVVNKEGTLKIHPFVDQYNHWVTERGKIAKLCVDAGIADRQTRVAEHMAQAIAQALRGLALRLGVPLDERFSAAARAELTLLQGGKAA